MRFIPLLAVAAAVVIMTVAAAAALQRYHARRVAADARREADLDYQHERSREALDATLRRIEEQQNDDGFY